MSSPSDPARQLLRHTVATVAYRSGKMLRGAPASFGNFQSANNARTPAQVLAHICDLFDWALSHASGSAAWHDSAPRAWDADVQRFFASLKKLDDYLGSNAPLHAPAEKLFQGPIADALTHVGQLAMLRRLAGSPVKGENYFAAEIIAGRVGTEQTAPRREFD